MTHSNDNDPLPFISLAALTANVVYWLESEKQKPERTPGNDNGEKAGKEQPGADREYIESRLRELAAFERRARGEAIRKRKM